MPGGIGKAAHLGQQLLPIMPRQPFIIPIGARPFAAMIKKTDIVVCPFERLYFAFDEVIELAQIVSDILGNFKQHGLHLSGASVAKPDRLFKAI